MRSWVNSLGVGTVVIGAMFYLAINKSRVSAIGCDTYYRVTGEIAGCTDISTEKAQEAWIEKYSVCLERQLAKEIVVYRGKLQTYYAEWKPENTEHNWEFDRLALPDIDTSSLSISSATYRGNADFCPD